MNHGLIYNTGIESFVIATAYFNLDEQRFVKTEPPRGACVLRCAPFEAAQILSGAARAWDDATRGCILGSRPSANT